MRRTRRLVVAAAVALVLTLTALTYRLFVWPQTDPPRRVRIRRRASRRVRRRSSVSPGCAPYSLMSSRALDFARLLASWLETTLVKLSFQANHLLAQRSAGAAKEVKGLIQATLERVRSTHLLVGQSGTALDDGVGK